MKLPNLKRFKILLLLRCYTIALNRFLSVRHTKTRAIEDINISIALDDLGVIPLICQCKLNDIAQKSALIIIDNRGHQPLTDPRAIPLMMYFDRHRYTIISGTIAIPSVI